jgi:hypothetical protein
MKMDLKELHHKVVESIHLVHDADQWQGISSPAEQSPVLKGLCPRGS